MKKYYPVDFDEKGNAVLGNAKSTPTSNGFIPTTWTPGGGSEDAGNGIKSITISPAITTTPALESLFPIYYEDLTEEQKQQGVEVTTAATEEITGNMSATITPTMDMYVVSTNGEETVFGEKGQPFTVELKDNGASYLWIGGVADSNTPDTIVKIIQVSFAVEKFGDE